MKSVPLHILVEAQEHVVTVELSTGETYRGRLRHAEDNMNLELLDVTVTGRNGEPGHMDAVFVRGSHIKMILLPEVLKYAPVLRPDIAQKAQETAKQKQKQKQGRSGITKPPRKAARTN